MTIADACALLVQLMRELAAERALRATERELRNAALAQLYEQTQMLKRERAAHHRVLEDYRTLRASQQRPRSAA